jgi:glycosyltransferase involved in cell wall biosynthesis
MCKAEGEFRMTMAGAKQRIQERLRGGQGIRQTFENALVLLLLLVPRRWCAGWVRRRIAERIYDCAAAEVFLYKSGRAALRGLMEALRTASSDRHVAYVPDYVCNVVGDACRAAGFATVEYATDERCLPKWKELEERVRQDTAPVVVLCSLFGSVPAQAPEAVALEQANSRIFIVADECQNLMPDSPIKARANRAVVFSFNDKTCPGVMGGGVVCPGGGGLAPVFAKGKMLRRILCSTALFRQWLLRVGREAAHMVRLTWSLPISYRASDGLEFSTGLRPHYDLVAEPIYKLSAVRAWVSLLFLESYRRFRIENARALRSGLDGLQVGLDLASAQTGPPFLPVMPGANPLPATFPAPVKAAYGRSVTQAAASRHWIALKTNTPYVRYEIRDLVVAQLTSRHAITDNRILHGMARTAEAAGYQSVVMGPARGNEMCGQIHLLACPVLRDEQRASHAGLLIRLLRGAVKSQYSLFQIHDPDLVPVGLILKLLGRHVIYDVHDDYEASFRVRFRARGWIGRWFASGWGWFERNAARRFDGVVVADRHLAQKFFRCKPVILGNYPRLDFTPAAAADHEPTFNLIYVGGVTRERGLEMALKALRLLPMPTLRLHIIGTSRETDLLEMLKADPRVVMHGRVAWTELHRHYVHAHVGLAFYQPLESFLYYPGENAVKVVEYMAAGIPVLCSNFPGLKTFVEDSGCGLVVPPDDPEAIAAKIRSLIDNAELRRKLGATGRRLFESEYNWEKHEGKLVELYRRIFRQ